MIKDIIEVNLPAYATLSQATVTVNEMGDKTITAQMRIDGRVVPDFVGTDGESWTLEFKGEKYILPIREPQATKDNTSLKSIIDLTFYQWATYQLKRYYFIELTSVGSGTAIADKYKASLGLTLPNFAVALQNVLDYYFNGKIVVDLNATPIQPYSSEPVYIDINYSYIWDVLGNLNDIFDVRWTIAYNATQDKYSIRIGYQSDELTHTFEYGFEGGLLKFERQVQSDEIKNIILGRGGAKNLPRLYFKDYSKYKPEGSTLDNGDFEPDPDAVPELMNIYFDALRDSNFRKYIRGWKAQKGYDGAVYQSGQGWAYEKGYTDTKFNPVEYVKDDDSIAKYGERWGALDANEDIYPSIQSVTVDPYGRIDEVVSVSQVTSDDLEAYGESAAVKVNIPEMKVSIGGINARATVKHLLESEAFTVESGTIGNLTYSYFIYTNTPEVTLDTARSRIVVVNVDNDAESPISGIQPGTYFVRAELYVVNNSDSLQYPTFGVQEMLCTSTNTERDEWKPTFDIWVKNIWGTSKNAGETDFQYADRVWRKILGDREGNEAAVVFSDGFLSVSSDYEFPIVGYAYDTSKSLGGVQSEWRLTLAKSDAEMDATGLYIPNAQTGGNASAGDHFFFINIDMPFQYVKWAEEKITAYKEQEGLSEYAELQPTWTVTLDKIRINTPDSQLFGQKIVDSLDVGCVVNIRDKRFTNNDTLQLYIKSITYNWSESSIIPDVEIVLSDKIIAVKSSVETLQSEVSTIKRQYITTDDVRQVVEPIVSSSYLRKSGTSDTSYSPTQFASTLSQKDFRVGDVGGYGWGFYLDGEGKSILETDRIVVREEARFNQLVVNQVAYSGGKQIISAASIECTRVDDTDEGYVCHFDQKRGSVGNLFVVDDVAMNQRFNPSNTDLSAYKMRVIAVSEDSITLSKTDKSGEGVPQKGDVIVQYGNYTDTSRQFVIVRDVIGGGYERMLEGLTSVTSEGKEYYFAGTLQNSAPRLFLGDKTREYIEYDGATGTFNIKATVNFQAGSTGLANISDWGDNFTAIQGGLILTSAINLGYSQDGTFHQMSGISGQYDSSAEHGGVAAWYGGTKDTAKTLFNMDGTGYLAGGNITWDADGAGSVAGGALSWDKNGVPTLNVDGVNLSLDGDESKFSDLVLLVAKFNSMFTREGTGTTSDPYVIRANYDLYSVGSVSAYGKGTSGGGGTSSGTLAGLSDVLSINGKVARTGSVPAQSGDLIVYNGTHWYAIPQSSITPDLTDYAKTSDLLSDGFIKSSLLPSYVDDVEEYASRSVFPATGESGKVYIDASTNKTYRWSGSTYVTIGSDLALGETSSTAYAGDKGKANATAISTLQGYFSNGIAKKATADANGNDISTTYLTKTAASSTYAVNSGVVHLAGYETITGAKTFSVLDNARFYVSTNVSFTQSANNAIAYSPFAKYTWHDHFAFLNNHSVIDAQYTEDGSTWNASSLNLIPLFSQKEYQSINILRTTDKAFRFTVQSSAYHACLISYFALGVNYTKPFSHFDMYIEISADNETWTELHSSEVSTCQITYFFYTTSFPSYQYYIRFTFTKTSELTTGTVSINSLSAYTKRKGNQGLGREYEFPYKWDATSYDLTPITATQQLGTTASRWNKVIGKDADFSGEVKGTTIVKSGGTSSQFLKADGSVDSNSYVKSTEVDGIKDKSYTHNQGSASADWTVTHNLGKYPSVSVVINNKIGYADVEYVNENSLIIHFGMALSGKAYLN